MKQIITEARLKYWQSLRGRKLTPEHRLKVIKTLKSIRKGGTYEEAFGTEIATQMKEKMRQVKLGKKMPWNSVPTRIGEKSPRWIKDRTLIKNDKERGGQLHKYWSKEVKRRDNWKCKLADENCSGKVISHHILSWKDYPELRYIINNGITLCHTHHPRRRVEEKRLIETFQKLVSVSK